MNIKRIVIAGGPGSGKTSLIYLLEKMGYKCMHEISREVTKKAQDEGIDQLFLNNPILFSELLLEGRINQFNEIDSSKNSIIFYDRGLPDIIAYMNYVKQDYPEKFDEACFNYQYDKIFILPPWPDIYLQDNERYETFKEAEELFDYLIDGYQKYKYDLHEIPFGTLEERAQFIIDNIT